MNIYVETLGCARNQVDGEMMVGQLASSGFDVVTDPETADLILVNTCGFIEPAIDESIDTILYFSELKQAGRCRYLMVAGCLPQRFGEDMVPDLPEVDLFVGTGALHQVPDLIRDLSAGPKTCFPDPARLNFTNYDTIRANDPKSPYAYVKIAEGCDKHCTYCIIPKLRGPQKSRPAAEIEKEVRQLVGRGIKEIVLVAQETSFYGRDLKTGDNIAELAARLSGVSDNIWIRLMYGHPESMDDRLIKTIADHDNICPYFDIPIQHASDPVLKRMGRLYTSKDLVALFDRIRSLLPQAVLRTTVITGFPGETPGDFKKLMQFVNSVRFDHLGVFAYSDFEDLPSHGLGNHVSAKTAQKRADTLMASQRDISSRRLGKYLDRRLTVLIEETPEPDVRIGRTMFQAPEVDGIVYVRSTTLDTGTFAKVKITDTLEYDLIGEPE